MHLSITCIRGHVCTVEVIARLGFALDVEVIGCASCPSLVGRVVRVLGGDL